MALALEIAKRANALRFDDFPDEAVNWAKVAITDMLGCALAGAGEDTSGIALKLSAAEHQGGKCTVLGTAVRLPSLDAAFVNGVAGHALDFDDTSKSMAGHPTVIILPPILALGEDLDVSGRALLEAYVVGLETATRIARGVNFYHYEKGWHPTSTLGIFGAAAACGRLLGLDDSKLATALSICVSLACGVKSNFGSQTKPLHAGVAARNGLLAARLASQGFTASAEAFEHPQGFLAVFNGPGHYDAARILPDWGQPLDLLAPGISIKKYPCVYSVHGAIDCAVALRQKYGLRPEAIKRVMVTMHERRLLPHVQRRAENALDAKFSLSYAVARALVDGRVSLDHFEGKAYADPVVHRVMGTIVTQGHSDDARDYSAEVRVELSDGRHCVEAVPAPVGQGPENPLTPEMLRAKFEDCAGRVLEVSQINSLFEALRAIDSISSVRALTTMMIKDRSFT